MCELDCKEKFDKLKLSWVTDHMKQGSTVYVVIRVIFFCGKCV